MTMNQVATNVPRKHTAPLSHDTSSWRAVVLCRDYKFSYNTFLYWLSSHGKDFALSASNAINSP